jgi:hypothetical protein
MKRLLRNVTATAFCVIALTLTTGISAGATGQPGAPNNTCGESNPTTPGNAANSPGSPFNPSGQAGLVYAGNDGTASKAHSNSTAAVSQYDVACVQLSH